MTTTTASTITPKGFFASLYDLSFHSFITPKIIQIIYIIALIGVGFWSLMFLVTGFTPSYGFFGNTSPSGGQILLHVIGAPVCFVLGSIGARIYLEFVIAVFRIAENTEVLRYSRPELKSE